MSASNDDVSPLFGFLRVADLGGAGLIGGYLLLNVLGRPLEFHCTEPVKPNRAQQILYGAVLDDFLYGEHVARTLVEHSSLSPRVIFTDQDSVLSLRGHIQIPVALVSTVPTPLTSREQAHFGGQPVYVDRSYAHDRGAIERLGAESFAGWDLQEPFRRIDEAIAELQKAA